MTILIGPFSSTNGGGSGDFTPKVVYVNTDYQILLDDDYIITDGSNTLTFPILAQSSRPFFVINEGMNSAILDGNGEVIPNGNSLSFNQVRGFISGTSGWLEI